MVDFKSSKQYSTYLKKKLRNVVRTGNIAGKIEKYYRESSRVRKFSKLTKSTKVNRGKMARYNKTHKKYSRNRSNLTFSGQLIDSIKAFIKISKSAIELVPTGKRKPYTLKSGKPSKTKATNAEVVLAQAYMNRHLMIPTAKQRKNIIKIFREGVRRVLKR